MKKYLVSLMAVCGTSAALAANYNLTSDWNIPAPNPNGVWSYGARVEATWPGGGDFGPFVPAANKVSDWADRWSVAGTADTCTIGKTPGGVWTFPAGTVIANAWVNYASVARLSNAVAGVYALEVKFTCGGYVTPTTSFPHVKVVVQKNGTSLWSTDIYGFNSAGVARKVTLAPTDVIDFIVANENPNGEGRASIDASLTASATNALYSVADDWVAPAPNPNGAWSYGYMFQASLGGLGYPMLPSFQAFQITTNPYNPGIWNAWEAPNTYDSCWVGQMIAQPWTFPVGSVVLNAWDGVVPAIHWAPSPGTYNLNAFFQGGGYAGPTVQYSEVYVIKNTSTILFSGPVLGYGTANNSQQITFASGDYLDFVVAQQTNGYGETRVQLDATLARVQEPAVLLSASRPLANPQQVTVHFFEALYAPTANNPANYTINNGVTVTAAQLSPTDPTTVVLTVTPGVDYPSVLTVNNVANDYGHLPVAANSTASISVPINVPLGLGIPTNGAQPALSGTTLSTNWQIAAVNYDGTQSNYYYSQVFVQSNGVLHCHATTNSSGDLNYLIYVNPNYEGATEEALMHFTINAASFSGTAVAGAAVCVEPNPWFSSPPGGDCLRAVNSGYAGVTNYPFFLTCSDYIADNSSAGVEPYNLQWKVGGSYWLRIRQDDAPSGGIISTKAWLGDGTQAEPASWQSVWTDPGGYTRVGYAAIRAGYSGTMDFDVDYFLVTAPGLPALTPTLPASLAPVVDLRIALNGTNATLSWPASVETSYHLQSTSALGSSWGTVTNPVVVSGSQNRVTKGVSGQRQFFRLSQ